MCISVAIFSTTSEEALLKSGQSLSPVVSDLGRGKLAFESVNGSSGLGGIDFIYKLERQMALALGGGEGGKGATARSRCIVERVPRTNGPSVIKMSPLGNSTTATRVAQLLNPCSNFFLLPNFFATLQLYLQITDK